MAASTEANVATAASGERERERGAARMREYRATHPERSVWYALAKTLRRHMQAAAAWGWASHGAELLARFPGTDWATHGLKWVPRAAGAFKAEEVHLVQRAQRRRGG